MFLVYDDADSGDGDDFFEAATTMFILLELKSLVRLLPRGFGKSLEVCEDDKLSRES